MRQTLFPWEHEHPYTVDTFVLGECVHNFFRNGRCVGAYFVDSSRLSVLTNCTAIVRHIRKIVSIDKIIPSQFGYIFHKEGREVALFYCRLQIDWGSNLLVNLPPMTVQEAGMRLYEVRQILSEG